MPFVIAILGIILLVTVLRGTEKQFGQLLASEFQGNGNFIYWIVSVGIIGAIGYVKELKIFSDLFLALLLVVLFLKKGTGFFAQLNAAIKAPGSSTTDEANTTDTSSSAQTFNSSSTTTSPNGNTTSASSAFNIPSLTSATSTDPLANTLTTPSLGSSDAAPVYDMTTGDTAPLYDMTTGQPATVYNF